MCMFFLSFSYGRPNRLNGTKSVILHCNLQEFGCMTIINQVQDNNGEKKHTTRENDFDSRTSIFLMAQSQGVSDIIGFSHLLLYAG